MRALSTVRWAVQGSAALALSCAAVAGCGTSSASSPGAAGSAPAATSSPSAGGASANNGKLTGNFCTDLKNIGRNMPIPVSVSGSLATMEQHDGRYLKQVAAYYNKLAAEAPPQVGQDISRIASVYQQLASSVVKGGSQSLTQIEQHMDSLTSSGPAAKAFKQLVVYVTTKCA
jgi:hypothetical protein